MALSKMFEHACSGEANVSDRLLEEVLTH